MMATVKDLVSRIGDLEIDRGGFFERRKTLRDVSVDRARHFGGATVDAARHVGGITRDTAKHVGGITRDTAKHVGGITADYAKYAAASTKDLAKRIGPKRGLIGLAILGAVVGGSVYLVRYLRARREEALEDIEGLEEPGTVAGVRVRKQSRAKRKAANAISH